VALAPLWHEPDVARFEALLTSRGRELLDLIATEAPGPDTALRIGASLRGLYPTELVIEALAHLTSVNSRCEYP